jgi:hypothetical protein
MSLNQGRLVHLHPFYNQGSIVTLVIEPNVYVVHVNNGFETYQNWAADLDL